jgi:hypothetical protein
MKTKDIFQLALRLLGLVFLYHTLRAIPAAVVVFKDALPEHFYFGMPRYANYVELLVALLMVGWPLLVTIWLVRGAHPILRLAYPDAPARAPIAGAAVEERSEA